MLKEGAKIHLAKLSPPPPDLPVYQQMDPRDVSFIGRTTYEAPPESKKFVFGIKRKDRRRHLYVIGKTGVGKSKLFELLMRQDITYDHGMCLIDPHGDLVESMLDFIPEARLKDVVVADPTDAQWPISFNPLKGVPQELRHQMAQGFIEVIAKQFGSRWSHRIEHVLRLSLLALLDYPEATLQGIIHLLTDKEYRMAVIPHISETMVKRFFEVEFDEWATKFDTDAMMPIVNYIAQFLAIPMLRNIFTQKENKISIDEIIEKRKILLINLAKGKIGEENASFFGSLFMNKIKQAGMARADAPDDKRKDFHLYLSEFHTVMSGSFINLFSEARKYGFTITVAHQYIAQLDPAVLATVLGNVGTIIAFRVGGEDAEKLETEMTPVFKAKDMINLGTREFYIKETIDGEVYDPFSAETLAVLAPTHVSLKAEIINASRKTYAMALAEV
ncbi:MAG: type IV secretion system DNA-binding domain-containing protein [Candidatus Sungbacteria bacterium]|nr:type IV secretion system DNA-binding domain-containing protein [bacterium]MDZ4260632.1 type IV secretion system DNA-binding domain-containing protein [Candidatus Sungbacteria bacterium]